MLRSGAADLVRMRIRAESCASGEARGQNRRSLAVSNHDGFTGLETQVESIEVISVDSDGIRTRNSRVSGGSFRISVRHRLE